MTPTYVLLPARGAAAPAIQCLRCGRISYNPNDIREKYCGFCHRFHDDPAQEAAR